MKKVRAGEPLRISADTFNSFIDAADAHRRGMMSLPGPDAGSSGECSQLVLVRNNSGADQGRYAILAINGIALSPTDNLRAFQSRPVFTAGMATPESTKLVILQEPIAAGRIGEALVAGVSAVRINITDVAHTYAKPTSGDAAKLTSDGASGPFRILYVEPGTGSKWAAVQWPVGGVAGVSVARFDGSRSGNLYTGHLWTGTQGDAIQWVFDWGNDPGIDAIIDEGAFVMVIPCPAWLAASGGYGDVATHGEKYVAASPIWGVIA